MLKNKKLFVVLLITLILLVLSLSSCFASSGYNYTIGTGPDNSYGYNVSTFNGLVESAKNDSRVTSGEYYYFVSYNYGDRVINSVLVNKNACDIGYGYLNTSFWNERGYYHYILNLSSSDLTTNDIIYLSGMNALKNDNTSIVGLSVCSNSDNVFYFATNYDKTIYCDSTCEQVFTLAPGVVTPALEGVEMTQAMKEIVGLVPLVIGLLVLAIGLRKALQTLFQVLKNS